MENWPVWNYWMYDEAGEYRYELEFGYGHPDAEFLTDTVWEDEWTYKFFWSVDEAAALSFGRSPSVVRYDQYMREMDGSSEFASYFCRLRETILAAQSAGTLATPIPAKMYIDWTEGCRVPFPPVLAEKVRSNFNKMIVRMNGAETEEASEDSAEASNKGSEPSRSPNLGQTSELTHYRTPRLPARASQPEDQPGGSDLRQHRTLLGIIYALAWRHHHLGSPRHSTFSVATRIASVLDDLRPRLSGAKLEGNEKTIKKYLDEALDHFGDSKEFER